MAGTKSLSMDLSIFDNEELLALAKLDMDADRVDQALYKVKHLVSSKKADAQAFSLAGKIYAQLGLFEKAKTFFKQSTEMVPDSVIDHFQLGMVHFESDDRDEALSIWNKLLDEHPTHPPALFYKGLLLAQDGKASDAQQTLGILLQSAPADNLYFKQAKELLQSLTTLDASSGAKAVLPNDAYKVIN